LIRDLVRLYREQKAEQPDLLKALEARFANLDEKLAEKDSGPQARDSYENDPHDRDSDESEYDEWDSDETDAERDLEYIYSIEDRSITFTNNLHALDRLIRRLRDKWNLEFYSIVDANLVILIEKNDDIKHISFDHIEFIEMIRMILEENRK